MTAEWPGTEYMVRGRARKSTADLGKGGQGGEQGTSGLPAWADISLGPRSGGVVISTETATPWGAR
jgi:hypothetical protein